MKKTLFIAALMSMFIGSTNAQEKFSFKLYGFVRNYACYDTRESLTSNSEQFYYMPKNVNDPNNDGTDLNAQPNMMLLSITTRLGVNITGPEFLGAKTSAKIESDFAGFGTSNTVLRIRQAYAKMNWEHNALLVGQAWHPMMGDMMPDVFSLETGAPFTPFSRTPQVRYDYTNKGFTLTATALYQFQYTSYGPKDAAKGDYTSTGSFDYARNAVAPEVYLQAMYKNGGFQAGVGVDLLTLKPRQSYSWTVKEFTNSAIYNADGTPKLDENGNQIFEYVPTGNETTKTYKCGSKDMFLSITPTVFASYKGKNWGIKGRATYAQNAAHLSMISGYGVTAINQENGEWEYTPLESVSGWIDATYKVPLEKGNLQFCCFAGYTKNLGCDKEIVGNIYMRGEKNMDYMWRVAPSILYTHNAMQIGVEYNPTTVGYGKHDGDYKMYNPRPVTNHRICAMLKYNF